MPAKTWRGRVAGMGFDGLTSCRSAAEPKATSDRNGLLSAHCASRPSWESRKPAFQTSPLSVRPLRGLLPFNAKPEDVRSFRHTRVAGV